MKLFNLDEDKISKTTYPEIQLFIAKRVLVEPEEDADAENDEEENDDNDNDDGAVEEEDVTYSQTNDLILKELDGIKQSRYVFVKIRVLLSFFEPNFSMTHIYYRRFEKSIISLKKASAAKKSSEDIESEEETAPSSPLIAESQDVLKKTPSKNTTSTPSNQMPSKSSEKKNTPQASAEDSGEDEPSSGEHEGEKNQKKRRFDDEGSGSEIDEIDIQRQYRRLKKSPGAAAAALLPIPKLRRKWTPAEEEAFIKGLQRHGRKYISILRDFPALKGRTNLQLKDKYKNLVEYGRIDKIPPEKRRR